MATVFGKEERDFYSAFFLPDSTRRRAALDAWIESTIPVVQAAVREELESLIESITKDRWTEDGWRRGEEKLRQMQNSYHLVMDIQLRQVSTREIIKGEIPAPIMRKTEIDLHGMKVSEAIPLVEEFLNESFNSHESRVWIIHGKGTGVLREQTRRQLENHPLVESFAPADQSHGEEGATQVDIIDWRVT